METSSPDAAQQACDAAKNAGIPIIFFNREVSDDVVNSYEQCAFVGTDAAEAGHMQGEMIGDYLLENYDTVDLNGDGTISYVLFKGQEGNAEAEYRTCLLYTSAAPPLWKSLLKKWIILWKSGKNVNPLEIPGNSPPCGWS